MLKRTFPILIAVAAAALWTVANTRVSAADTPPGTGVVPLVSILEKDGNPMTNPIAPPPYLEVLEKQGLIVGYPDPQKAVALSWEVMRKYNLLVVIRGPQFQGYTELSEEAAKEQADLLDRFLEEGGGILVFGGLHVGDTYNDHRRINEWLKKYEVQFGWDIVDDAAHLYKDPPPVPWQRPEYIWTTNFAASPITQGAKTLFIPHDMFWLPSVRTVQGGKDWQVLLSSEPTSVTWQLPVPLAGQVLERVKGSEKTGPAPLLAVRQAGKGRLAVSGIQATALWSDLGKGVGAQVASVRGDGQRTSDWLPLLRNLALWLSEPARAAGRPGGTKERVRTFINPQYGTRDPIQWERPDLSWPDTEIYRLYAMHAGPWNEAYWRETAAGMWKPFRFLVGAHSRASGGKGSVADWKTAAQKEGFDGIVFREKILEMTAEQWQAFEAECTAASDERFLAIPGQEFLDWQDNRFMRFQRRTPYPQAARLTPDKKRVKDQLAFFFDAGWPVNFPLTPKSNPNPWWAYSVYSSFPVAVYDKGKRIEDNTAEWQSLVERMEYPTPLGVHLLEDPAEVAGTAADLNLNVLAPSLKDIQTNPRWDQSSLGHGTHNITIAYASNGPVIEAFLPLNHYRATLGDRDVPGSYRYRIVIRARSDAPLKQVELWGGGQLLRRYRPDSPTFMAVVDDQHDRQRGMLLKITDAKGREALATSIMVHDKMMVWYWCGDHCNALPYGQGVDRKGNPTGLGLATHVKRQLAPATGPGGTFAEAWDYVPSGTDTSLPGLGLFGELSFWTEQKWVPASNVWLVPDVRFWYSNRDLLITRQTATVYTDTTNLIPKEQPAINGWYPYTRVQPTEDYDLVVDDLDFHRDAGQPSLQFCRGEVRFKRDLTLSDKTVVNLVLTRLGWRTVKNGMYTVDGRLPQPGQIDRKLGKGNYVTWPADLGHGTVYALDDDFAAAVAVDAKGLQNGRPTFGYALGNRAFKKGDTYRYQFLLMRWPVGSTMDDRLDAKVQTALNLARPDSGVKLTATTGTVNGTQVMLDLVAKDGVFRGLLEKADFGMRIPVRIKGLNPNWTAGVWCPGQTLFIPVGNDPDGYAWTSLDPAAVAESALNVPVNAGAVFIGNVVSCDKPDVILRLLQRTGGGWELLLHNPLEKKVKVTVRGADGGPVPELRVTQSLLPGQELRLPVSRGE